MDEEFIKRLSDYFTATELVELLDIPVDDIVNLYKDKIEEAYEDLEDIMAHGH